MGRLQEKMRAVLAVTTNQEPWSTLDRECLAGRLRAVYQSNCTVAYMGAILAKDNIGFVKTALLACLCSIYTRGRLYRLSEIVVGHGETSSQLQIKLAWVHVTIGAREAP
jgi:hypothetical protein